MMVSNLTTQLDPEFFLIFRLQTQVYGTLERPPYLLHHQPCWHLPSQLPLQID